MALIKTIASYKLPDGTWTEQQDVEMTELEELAIRADWALGEHEMKKPPEMTDKDKIDALSDSKKGVAFIEKELQEQNKKMESWKSQYDVLSADKDSKYQEYIAQVNK